MRISIVCFFTILLVSLATAQSFRETFYITPYGIIQSFKWEEFDSHGRSALKETGPMFSFGLLSRFSIPRHKNLFTELDLRYSFSIVNYDGYIVDRQGIRSPYKTVTGYSHSEGTWRIGYSFRLINELELVPSVGYCIEYWDRDLDDGGRNGYNESYSVSVAEVGMRLVYHVSSDLQVFAAGHYGFPLSLSETVEFASRGHQLPALNLLPGVEPRYQIQAGTSLYRVLAMIYVETWNLLQSEVDKGFYQPHSTRTHWGLKLGYTICVQE
jgi:hypothetical protein